MGLYLPTVFTHPAVPLAIGLGLGHKTISSRLLLCGALASALPDLDVIAFHFGIPYASDFGHRGFTHSLLFALGLAMLGATGCRWLRASFFRSFLFLFVSVGSHGLLDTFTNGGLGIALFWPWTDQRYFAPFQPIEVSPLGLDGFLSRRGIEVLKSELIWVWLPAMAVGAVIRVIHRAQIDKGFNPAKRR
ncbi:MAG: metal-dependent hydrolase [Methylosarcina sp.]